MISQPNVKISDAFAALFIFLAILFLIVIMHILAINSTGGTKEILTTVFIVMLWAYLFIVILSFIGLLILGFWYFLWYISLPGWMKREMRQKHE